MIDNADIEKALNELPDMVARALFAWRRAEAVRAKVEGDTWLSIKESSTSSGQKLTSDDLRAQVKASQDVYKARMEEAGAEAVHARLYERLMSLKKTSGMRTAF